MISRKQMVPMAVLVGVIHYLVWVGLAGQLFAAGTSILYAVATYWAYRYLGRDRTGKHEKS